MAVRYSLIIRLINAEKENKPLITCYPKIKRLNFDQHQIVNHLADNSLNCYPTPFLENSG